MGDPYLTIGSFLGHFLFKGGEKVAYNVKIFEFPNGEVQVRRYSTPMISTKEENMYEDSNIEYNPFDYKRTKEVDMFEDVRELSEEEKEHNRWRNFNRTKQMVFQYARCAKWEWFITLTFSGEKVDRYDYDECSKKAREWLHNQRKRYAPDLMYLLVPEQHKDGAWHFHGLLANTGEMKFVDSGHKDKGEMVYNMIKWRYGFTTATRVKDIHKVAKYIGKYITKSVCDITPGRKRYFPSQNLPLPKVSTMLIPEDAEFESVMDNICESLGKKVDHVSRTRSTDVYTQVTYIELS